MPVTLLFWVVLCPSEVRVALNVFFSQENDYYSKMSGSGRE